MRSGECAEVSANREDGGHGDLHSGSGKMHGMASLAATLATLTLLAHGTTGLSISVNTHGAKLILELGDSNENGLLSLNETADFLSLFGDKKTTRDLARFDADHDGDLSIKEIGKAFSLTSAAVILWMDADDDGRLSIAEVESFLVKFGVSLPAMVISLVLDTDQDGFVGSHEIDAAPGRMMGLTKHLPPLLKMWVRNKLTSVEHSFEAAVTGLITL